MSKVFMSCYNGLGDKLLDVIGFYVICKYLQYEPVVQLNSTTTEFKWGKNFYDPSLFVFNDILLFDLEVQKNNINLSIGSFPFYIYSTNSSSSMAPFKTFQYLSKFFPELTFHKLSQNFQDYSKKIIQPSEIILSSLPDNLNRTYGIHLRKTDKVSTTIDIRHENSPDDFNLIIEAMINEIKNIILNEENPSFLCVSEDESWKKDIEARIQSFANENNKIISIVSTDYSKHIDIQGFPSVLDMFSLSKCKKILQGVKYSSFSILAALLGNNQISNFAHVTNNYYVCLSNNWKSVIHYNQENLNYDTEFHKKTSHNVGNIDTNIPSFFD